MYLSCEYSTQDNLSNFHKYSELITLIYLAKICNLQIFFNKRLLINNIFSIDKLNKINKKHNNFIFQNNNIDVIPDKIIDGKMKWEGLTVNEINNIIAIINYEKNNGTKLLQLTNVVKITPQIMYKFDKVVYENFISDFSNDLFGIDNQNIKNEVLIHIRSGDLLERFINEGLTFDYYVKIIEYYKNKYSLPINILCESLNTSRHNVTNKTKTNIDFFTKLNNYCKLNTINIIVGDAKNDVLRDYIELTKYKYLFLSGSSFSQSSLPLNIDKNIIAEKKVIKSRPNLLNNIELLPNVTLLDIENF